MLDCSFDVRKHQEFCDFFSLKQFISCLICIRCSSSTIIDHILENYLDGVSQKGIIDIGISDHQLIFLYFVLGKLFKRGGGPINKSFSTH